MRVYGALMWSISVVMRTPEVTRVYIGSFREQARHNCNRSPSSLPTLLPLERARVHQSPSPRNSSRFPSTAPECACLTPRFLCARLAVGLRPTRAAGTQNTALGSRLISVGAPLPRRFWQWWSLSRRLRPGGRENTDLYDQERADLMQDRRALPRGRPDIFQTCPRARMTS